MIFVKHCCATLLLTGAIVIPAQGEVVVVVSTQSSMSSITYEQVSQLFLGKVKIFPDGSRANPRNNADKQLYREFYSKVVHKTPDQLRAYWTRMIFTGRKKPFKSASSIELKNLIKSDKTVIGYIDESEVDDSLKVLLSF